MDFIKKHSFSICSLISLSFGALIFVLFFGYLVINPFYVDWILYRIIPIDLKETYLGWHYFWHAPWDFPFGIYNSLSYPIKTSILNTDSIPLFAIFFKLFKNILPQDFQYWGIYTLICYMLQSFLGMTIVRRFVHKDIFGNLFSILAGVFFCLLPSMMIMSFTVSTLSCHFIILACFIPIVYRFNLKTNIIYYSLIGFMAAGITPYILAISSLILLIFCLYKKQFLPFISFCISSLITLYSIGAFVGISDYTSDGLYNAGCNLNTFFNTEGMMLFFKGFPTVGAMQTQGFAYFGLGINILILIVLCNLLIKYLQDKISFKYKKETLLWRYLQV